MDVLITRALLLRVNIRAPDFWKLPYEKQSILWIRGGEGILYRDYVVGPTAFLA